MTIWPSSEKNAATVPGQALDEPRCLAHAFFLGMSLLHLDHVSLSVPGLREVVEQLDARLGLDATVSRADPDHHSRVYLDRAYLEVAAGETACDWRFSLFFLRFDDPQRLRDHLESEGFAYRFGSYQGVDGHWDNVELESGSVPVPILVRRTDPPDVAANWPPPLRDPHRCGARTLEAVHVAVTELSAAAATYGRLLGTEAVAGIDEAGLPCATFELASGQIVLSQGAQPGIAAIVLGVASLAEAAKVVGPLSVGQTAWLDAAAAHGLRIGLMQVRGST
jgi:hypothetical protein